MIFSLIEADKFCAILMEVQKRGKNQDESESAEVIISPQKPLGKCEHEFVNYVLTSIKL